jgi:hypothetical protein
MLKLGLPNFTRGGELLAEHQVSDKARESQSKEKPAQSHDQVLHAHQP